MVSLHQLCEPLQDLAQTDRQQAAAARWVWQQEWLWALQRRQAWHPAANRRPLRAIQLRRSSLH